ncbi:hypothetical protein [Polynucleobacter sp.]|uniref:hypothetical protein n=1 Tax=Polynucleobacter sp. TaxID=2029855 RepID=UPI003F696976
MNEIDRELWDRIGQMTSSIEESRKDANNRFAMLIQTVAENKTENRSDISAIQKEVATIRDFMLQLKVVLAIIFIIFSPASILATIQIISALKK